MDINPLIVDLKEYGEELEDSIVIAIGFDELELADRHIAHAIAEIKGKKYSESPFRQVAELYNLPEEEVVKKIRDFINKRYKEELFYGDPATFNDIEFRPL